MRRIAIWICFPVLLAATSELDRDLQRIFATRDYKVLEPGRMKWSKDGAAYTTVEESAIIRYETESGNRTVVASPSLLTPSGASASLPIDDYEWSPNGRALLIFTSAKKVWRQKTLGDYWVLDLDARTLKKLGGKAPPSALMFAKFSPQGNRVAYVRDNNIYAEDLSSGAIRALTNTGSEKLINGTFDWVNEEEFKLRDGFRWSPDGRQIAFWQFDVSGVQPFTLIDDTTGAYPVLTTYPYPHPGGTNSAVRVGVVSTNGGAIRWMDTPGDPRNTYIFRLTWTPSSGELLIGQLNRLQNTMTLFLGDATTGRVKSLFQDKDSAWVNVRDSRPDTPVLQSTWLEDGASFLWASERDGWNHLYSVSRANGTARLLTGAAQDVISVEGVDRKSNSIYFGSSPENATQRYLYRASLDDPKSVARVTPLSQPGTHAYTISPDCRWAFHTYSTFDRPPSTDIIRLPSHEVVRVLEDNHAVRSAVEPLVRSTPVEFVQVPAGDGVTLDAFLIKPPAFDSSSKYPAIVYVYGEPATASVLDAWQSERGMFHRSLAKEGYLIICMDNRGTPAPKGREWRKVIYKQFGSLPVAEQTAGLLALLKSRPYIDPSRIGVWGWSSGGTNTLNLMFRAPQVYRTGVAVAPVPDLTLYDTIYEERYLGVPDKDDDIYRRASPITFAEGLRGPLLLIHGSGDDNVHYQGSEKLINRLVELGKPFDFMEYPNRTHSIDEGPGTSLHLHSAIARFFQEHLPSGPRD
jgi:dipeptidyl-peptidase 4